MMKIKMKTKMMILLLILDIVTNKDIAELQAGVDRSPQAQAWYKLAFEGLHGRDEKQASRHNKDHVCNCTRTMALAPSKGKYIDSRYEKGSIGALIAKLMALAHRPDGVHQNTRDIQ